MATSSGIAECPVSTLKEVDTAISDSDCRIHDRTERRTILPDCVACFAFESEKFVAAYQWPSIEVRPFFNLIPAVVSSRRPLLLATAEQQVVNGCKISPFGGFVA